MGVVSVDTCHASIGELDLSGTDDQGATWRASIEEFEGWEGSPSSTGQSTLRPADHGAWSSRAFLSPRKISIGGTVVAPTHAGLHAAFRRLKTAVRLSATTFRVAEDDGIVRTAAVRRDGEVLARTLTTVRGKWSISLVADDPMLYSEVTHLAGTRLPQVSGGLVAPITPPITIAVVETSNQVTVLNTGDAPARPVMTIQGPVVNPVIQSQDTGQEMRFRTTLGDADRLVIDCARGSVILNDSVSRMNTLLGSSFIELRPGSTTLRYTAGSYDPDSSLRLTWRDTWT